MFVGFGALIAVRSGATLTVRETVWTRYVMMAGIWVIIAALAPIIISPYGVVAVGLDMGAITLFVAVFWHSPRATRPTGQTGS